MHLINAWNMDHIQLNHTVFFKAMEIH